MKQSLCLSDETMTSDPDRLDWPPCCHEDDDDASLLSQDSHHCREDRVDNTRTGSLAPLEHLPLDATSNIFRFLSVQDINLNVAVVSKALHRASRSQALWKSCFLKRWNCAAFIKNESDWFQAYRVAYENTNDLWILHGNCTYPCDGLQPGRCCIRGQTRNRRDREVGPPQEYCPHCRYMQNPLAQITRTNIETRAQVIAAATTNRIQNATNVGTIPSYSSKRAMRAFQNSSTLNRSIDVSQYRDSSLHFLTDLLFFPLHSIEDFPDRLKETFPDPSDQTLAQVASHSWHLVYFANPDYNRPLVWKVSVQRPDCFFVFPSEGYLRPGQRQTLVFGVTPFASLLAHATYKLDVHREAVDEFLANVYTEEAHLPAAPFLIQYHFAAVIPCRSGFDQGLHPFDARPMHSHRSTGEDQHQRRLSPWKRFAQPNQPVRTTYLSAHVNAIFPLDDFMMRTLSPFHFTELDQVFCAPQLLEDHPRVFSVLNNTNAERDSGYQGATYRTEKNCRICDRRWGIRFEECGHAYAVQMLKSQKNEERRDARMQKMAALLRHLSSAPVSPEVLIRFLKLASSVHDRIVDYKGASWLPPKQGVALARMEVFADKMYLSLSNLFDGTSLRLVPWRHQGVYIHPCCTSSMLTRHSELEKRLHEVDFSKATVKTEPHYLLAFAHLAHSPGNYCLGPQEDPNHLQRVYEGDRKFFRNQRGFVTDIFMDDPVLAMQAALCILQDPRSLLAHGIYDRVPYPGTVMRCPRDFVFDPITCRHRFCVSRSASEDMSKIPESYYLLQDVFDLESVRSVLKDGPNESSAISSAPCDWSNSLCNFVDNIPPPGVGRFALSASSASTEDSSAIQELSIHLDSSSFPRSNPAPPAARRNQNHLHQQARGLRLVNLVWALSSHLGWTVDENRGSSAVFVDRRILIGAQWLSISLLTLPLFWTLVLRYFFVVPSAPTDYYLHALPYTSETELRYLSPRECGCAAGLLVLFWLILGRWMERHTSRDFFRVMLEHVRVDDGSSSEYIHIRVFRFIERLWDYVCPLFLQRLTFTPTWNRRSSDDLNRHVAYWRHRQYGKRSNGFRASHGRGLVFDDMSVKEESRPRKLIFGFVVVAFSFVATSPHFFHNAITVFAGSISLGMSMSLQSMESCREGVSTSTSVYFLRTVSLGNVCILCFLCGQLIGSSGGILFLAEFIVTSLSLVLGGAGTISASAIESWATFFGLSTCAFWGYVFGRVAIMEGIRDKRNGFTSRTLCASIFLAVVLWVVAFFSWRQESPVLAMINRKS